MPKGAIRGPSLDDIEVFELSDFSLGQLDAGQASSTFAPSSEAAGQDSNFLNTPDVSAPETEAELQDAAPLSVFEGEGLLQAGTSCSRASQDDDEFDYAFTGGRRDGATHQQVQPRSSGLPPHLVSVMSGASLGSVMESEDEGEDDSDEERQEPASSSSSGSHGQQQQAAAAPATKQQPSKSRLSQAHGVLPVHPGALRHLDRSPPPAPNPLGADNGSMQAQTASGASTHSPVPSPRHTPHNHSQQQQQLHRISPTPSPSSLPNTSLTPEQLLSLLPEALPAPIRPSAPEDATAHASADASPAAQVPAAPQAAAELAQTSSTQSTRQCSSSPVSLPAATAGHRTPSRHSRQSSCSSGGAEVRLDDLQLQLPAPDIISATAEQRAAVAQADAAAQLVGPLALRVLSDKVVAAAASPRASDGLIGTAAVDGGAAAGVPGEDEWEVASKLRLQEMTQRASLRSTSNSHGVLSDLPGACPPLTYPEARAFYEASDIGMHRAQVLQSLAKERPGPLAKLLGWLTCSRPQRLTEGPLHEERVRLLALAKVALDGDVPQHLGILQGVYTSITGNPGPVPRFGAHWGDVGFQGDDPGTDLRSCGMLGLLQLLYLPHHDAAMARKMYELSRSTDQEFPLAIVSLNITRWTLCALRTGPLVHEARKRGSVLDAANAFYVGAFYAFYHRWSSGRLTMRQSGFVLKQLEEASLKHPGSMVKLAAHPDAEGDHVKH